MCLGDETEEIERSSDRIAEVSRGRSSRWSNDHPGQSVKADHRAKGRTVEKLSGKEKDNGEDSRNPTRTGRAWK